MAPANTASETPVYFITLSRYSVVEVPGPTRQMRLFDTRAAAATHVATLPADFAARANIKLSSKASALDSAWRFYNCAQPVSQ